MGRKVVFSAMILAGLVQMTPAIAQIEDRQDDWGRSPAPAAPAAVPEPAAPVEERSVEPARVADAQPAAPAPAPIVEAAPAPVAVAKVREPDLADRDLAAAPPEEARPVLVDPTAARRALASAARAAPPREEARPAPEPVLATAEPDRDREPAPASTQRVAAAPSLPAAEQRAPEPVYAEREPVAPPPAVERIAAAPARALPEYRDARPDRGGQYRAPAPMSAERAAQPGPNEREQYRRAASAAMERATRAADPVDVAEVAQEAEEAEALPAPVERAPLSRPVYAAQDDYPSSDRIEPEVAAPPPPARRPVYADRRAPYPAYPAEDAVEPGYGDREAPVYAEDDRQAPPGYPQDRRAPAPRYEGPGYEGRALEGDQDYALADRDYREPMVRDANYGRTWGDRGVARVCDNDRAARLQQRLRRNLADRRIDWRTARDVEAEIGHAEEMQRSYCSSGLSAWREERLDRQYAQIEDRLRYEEGRGGWR